MWDYVTCLNGDTAIVSPAKIVDIRDGGRNYVAEDQTGLRFKVLFNRLLDVKSSVSEDHIPECIEFSDGAPEVEIGEEIMFIRNETTHLEFELRDRKGPQWILRSRYTAASLQCHTVCTFETYSVYANESFVVLELKVSGGEWAKSLLTAAPASWDAFFLPAVYMREEEDREYRFFPIISNADPRSAAAVVIELVQETGLDQEKASDIFDSPWSPPDF